MNWNKKFFDGKNMKLPLWWDILLEGKIADVEVHVLQKLVDDPQLQKYFPRLFQKYTGDPWAHSEARRITMKFIFDKLKEISPELATKEATIEVFDSIKDELVAEFGWTESIENVPVEEATLDVHPREQSQVASDIIAEVKPKLAQIVDELSDPKFQGYHETVVKILNDLDKLEIELLR